MKDSSKTLFATVMTAMVLSGCGNGDAPRGNLLTQTLNYIRTHGFPSLADLKPTLPSPLARLAGVETDGTGLPVIPDALGGATFGDSQAAINGVLADARELSAQGFSEARRLEAVLDNLASPVYDMLGKVDLFGQAGAVGGASMLQGGAGGAAGGLASVFDDLADVLTYAIHTGGQDGLPTYVVLAGDAATGQIDISGLWPEAGNFQTGFRAKVRLAGVDDLAVDLTLAPGRIGGLVSSWEAQSCADDLWQVSINAGPGGEKGMKVQSHECPAERNALSNLALTGLADGNWGLQGGFAQSYSADEDTLRGFLGARQGFVVQAASPSSLDRLAAAAAVLGEADFAAPTQDKIDQFGIGQLVARYFQAKYFDPKRKKAKSGSILTNYDNVAYWACYADVISDAVEDEVPTAKDLCNGSDVDVEAALSAITALHDAIKGESLVPSDVKKTVQALVDVLTIRNTLFVGGDAAVAYKTAPDEAFATLDDKRKTVLPAALSDTSWKDGATRLLPPVLAKDVPDAPFKALQSGLSSFLKNQCEALVGDAAAKAGKSADADSVCG